MALGDVDSAPFASTIPFNLSCPCFYHQYIVLISRLENAKFLAAFFPSFHFNLLKMNRLLLIGWLLIRNLPSHAGAKKVFGKKAGLDGGVGKRANIERNGGAKAVEEPLNCVWSLVDHVFAR